MTALGRKHPGDPVRLGDLLGHPMEPWTRWARVVGIRKDKCMALHRVIVRVFDNDEEPWPTGEYRTTGLPVAFIPSTEGTR